MYGLYPIYDHRGLALPGTDHHTRVRHGKELQLAPDLCGATRAREVARAGRQQQQEATQGDFRHPRAQVFTHLMCAQCGDAPEDDLSVRDGELITRPLH